MDCQSPTPTSQNSLFFGEYICKLEIVDFNLPSNWGVSHLHKSKFAVLDLGFEMMGLGLDNRGRTTKNAYRRIYSLWINLPLLKILYFHLYYTFPVDLSLRLAWIILILLLSARGCAALLSPWRQRRASPDKRQWRRPTNGASCPWRETRRRPLPKQRPRRTTAAAKSIAKLPPTSSKTPPLNSSSLPKLSCRELGPPRTTGWEQKIVNFVINFSVHVPPPPD